MNYKLFLFILFTLSFSSCEKDDICVDGSAKTPLLIIEFYDVNNSSNLKNVSNLRVEQSGTDEGVVFNSTLPTSNPSRYLANGNKIAIPLNTLTLNSSFEFIFNYNTAASNTDIISFFYSTNNVFISRACGYKTNFKLDPTNTIVLIPDAANWIQNSIVTQPNIENENEVHVKIYF
jgi:hypothetical protein